VARAAHQRAISGGVETLTRAIATVAMYTMAIALCLQAIGTSEDSLHNLARNGADLRQPPLGLPPLAIAAQDFGASTSLQHRRISLGRMLFFDRSLSSNGTMSCAMCHVPDQGFTSNATSLSVGLEGKSLRRNAPSLLNVAWMQVLFHDGRAKTLEEQAWMPLLHPDEMGNPSEAAVLQKIRANARYLQAFAAAYPGQSVTRSTVAHAIAQFERTLVVANTRFDRWRFGGEFGAMSPPEIKGYELFAGKAGCARCHTIERTYALFTDQKFHATGAGRQRQDDRRLSVQVSPDQRLSIDANTLKPFAESRQVDLGRFEVTGLAQDRFAFRTPTLRNVAKTAPYMHDGSLASLDAVIDFYAQGGGRISDGSSVLPPIALDPAEKKALVHFLHALSHEAGNVWWAPRPKGSLAKRDAAVH
jgi:cytochrome c peroxidase